MKRWTATLSNVPAHIDIMLVCGGCGMRRPMARAILDKAAGGEEEIARVEARLRCSNCGAMQGRILLGYYTSDPA